MYPSFDHLAEASQYFHPNDWALMSPDLKKAFAKKLFIFDFMKNMSRLSNSTLLEEVPKFMVHGKYNPSVGRNYFFSIPHGQTQGHSIKISWKHLLLIQRLFPLEHKSDWNTCLTLITTIMHF
ncbi:hypothetical protein WDU94_008758 [Cyamophila willieti]